LFFFCIIKEGFVVLKKLFLFILVIFILTVSGNASERKKPLSLKELQDPKSPSYVPYPYPKTRNEIIEDLKYAINLNRRPLDDNKSSYGQKKLLNFLELNSDLIVAEIDKVENRRDSFVVNEYYYYIAIKDKKNGKEVIHTALADNGLYVGAAFAPEKEIHGPFKNKAEALKGFSAFTNISDIKAIKRICMSSPIAPDPFLPGWELIVVDNLKYYMDPNNNIYKLRRVVNWEPSKDFNPEDKYTIHKNEIIVRDSLNKKLLFLKKLK